MVEPRTSREAWPDEGPAAEVAPFGTVGRCDSYPVLACTHESVADTCHCPSDSCDSRVSRRTFSARRRFRPPPGLSPRRTRDPPTPQLPPPETGIEHAQAAACEDGPCGDARGGHRFVRRHGHGRNAEGVTPSAAGVLRVPTNPQRVRCGWCTIAKQPEAAPVSQVPGHGQGRPPAAGVARPGRRAVPEMPASML